MLPHLQDERNLVPPKIKDAQNFCRNHACMFFRERMRPCVPFAARRRKPADETISMTLLARGLARASNQAPQARALPRIAFARSPEQRQLLTRTLEMFGR